jgi:hypothetical protein
MVPTPIDGVWAKDQLIVVKNKGEGGASGEGEKKGTRGVKKGRASIAFARQAAQVAKEKQDLGTLICIQGMQQLLYLGTCT